MRLLTAVASALCLIAAAETSPADAGTVLGRLSEPGVVWVDDGSEQSPIDLDVRNAHKSFLPPLSVIPVGSSIRFPNEDDYYHSIYSDSAADPFDIGYYSTGPGKDVSFSRPGVVEVRCHVHVMMRATIVVVNGPSSTISDPVNFSYILAKVLPGTHALHAWSPTHGLRTTIVHVPRDGRVTAAKL